MDTESNRTMADSHTASITGKAYVYTIPTRLEMESLGFDVTGVASDDENLGRKESMVVFDEDAVYGEALESRRAPERNANYG